MLNNEEITKKVLTFINDAEDSQKLTELRTRAVVYQDFRNGRQWTEEDWNIYKSKGITPVTVNRCKPIIKGMMGMYLNNRQSIKVRPRRKGTEAAAQVWSEVLKHAEDQSNCDYIYSNCFERGLVDAEGYLCFDVDETKTANGQPMIRDKSLFDVDIDPNCESYNINDKEDYAKYAIVRDWLDREIVEIKYPDFDFAPYTQGYTGDQTMGADMIVSYLNDDISGDKNSDFTDDELKRQYRFRVRTVWWKEAVKGVLVTDGKTGMTRVVSEASDKKTLKAAKKAKKMDRYATRNYPTFILHKTMMLGDKILEDIPNPFGVDVKDIPVFRFSPYYYDGYASGQLDDVTSLNMEENIHRTQTNKLLNKTANSGWKIKKKISQPDYNMLQDYGDVDGLVLDESKFGGSVEKIEPNRMPEGHFRQSLQYEQDSKKVAGIDDATMGMDSGQAESGKAIGLKKQQNQISSETAFDKFYFTLELLGEYMLLVIRKNEIYTDDEIKSIVIESSLLDEESIERARIKLEGFMGAGLPQPQPIQMPAPDFISQVKPEDRPEVMQTMREGLDGAMQYQKAYPTLKNQYDKVLKRIATDMLMVKLRDEKIAEYGIEVTISPSAPTAKMMEFIEMSALNQNYPGIIPPDIYIDATSLRNKEAIKARIMQNQQGVA